MINTDPAANVPVAALGRVPGKSHAWAPEIGHGIGKNCRYRMNTRVGNPIRKCGPGCQQETAELKATVSPGRVIGKVVPAQGKREGEVGFDLPVILAVEAKRSGLSAENHRSSQARKRVVGPNGLAGGIVLHQLKQVIERKARTDIGRREVAMFDAVSSIKAELNGVGSVHEAQDRAPVVHGPPERARTPSSTHLKACIEAGDIDRWYFEVCVLSVCTPNTGKPKTGFPQKRRAKGVRVVRLTVAVPHDVQRLQTCPGSGLLLIEGVVVVAEVEAVLFCEVFIQAE